MLGVRFAVSISHNRLFGTRSLGLCRTAASSRVGRSTSDMESPTLSRRARRRLPAVRGVVGIVRRSYHRGASRRIRALGRAADPMRPQRFGSRPVTAAIAGRVGSGDGAAGWPKRLWQGSGTQRPPCFLILAFAEFLEVSQGRRGRGLGRHS
jgi:hypothetical protein